MGARRIKPRKRMGSAGVGDERLRLRINPEREVQSLAIAAQMMTFMAADPYGPFNAKLFHQGLERFPELRNWKPGTEDIRRAIHTRHCAAVKCIDDPHTLPERRAREEVVLQRIRAEYPDIEKMDFPEPFFGLPLTACEMLTVVAFETLMQHLQGRPVDPQFEAVLNEFETGEPRISLQEGDRVRTRPVGESDWVTARVANLSGNSILLTSDRPCKPGHVWAIHLIYSRAGTWKRMDGAAFELEPLENINRA